MKTLSLKKKFFYAVLIFLALIFSIEKISQHIEKKVPPLSVDTSGGFSESSRAFIPNSNGAIFLNPNKKMIFNYQSFMRIKDKNTIRIALLGESSVFNLYPLQNLMAEKLKSTLKTDKKIEILNFGANSYGSTRLTIVAKELVTYKPDVVFIYIGNNEFEELEQLDLISPGRVYIADTIYRSAFARLVSRILLSTVVTSLKKEREERFFSSFPNVYPAKYHHFTDIEIKTRMEIFHKNLEQILILFQSNKIKVVMSTIPSNYVAPYLRYETIKDFMPFVELYRNHEYTRAFELSKRILQNTPGRHQATDEENSVIKRIASIYQVTFFDFENFIIQKEPHHIPGETLFFDHCHLNVQGNYYLNEELVKNLAASIRKTNF